MDQIEFIRHWNSAVPETTCQKVIDHYYANAEWHKSSFSTAEGISPETSDKVLMNEYWIKNGDPYYELLKYGFKKMVDQYVKEQKRIIPEQFTEFRLNHYPKGGFMKNHIDNIHHSHGQKFGFPHLTALLFLNDDYEGGEISLCDGAYVAPKKQGSGIVFPSNFMFPHEVKEVTKGHRYSLMTWIL